MTEPHEPVGSAAQDPEADERRFERECRLRELALKEREQANKDSEIDFRRRDLQSALWRSPLTVAIFAAAVAGASNAVVALVNGSLQRDLERTRREADIQLERAKSESTRILEMIKTGDNDHAAGNLDFLIRSGLVTDQEISRKLTAYLAERKPGTGPSLPASNSRVAFDDAGALERPVQDAVQDQLNKYLAYLDGLGFPPSATKVTIHVDPKESGNAYYVDSRIVIDKRFASDASVALHEYSHHALTIGHEHVAYAGPYAAIESGLADYFSCSFLGTPLMGQVAAKAIRYEKPYFRNLDNQRRYPEIARQTDLANNFEAAEVWGGLFWDLRKRLGATAADQLLAKTWLGFAAGERRNTSDFVARLVTEAAHAGAAQSGVATTVLRERGFPVAS